MNENTITELGYIQKSGDLRYIAQQALEALAIIALSYKYRIDKKDTPPYIFAQDALEKLGVDLESLTPHVEQALEEIGWPKEPLDASEPESRQYRYRIIECPECGRDVAENWYIRHIRSGCCEG